MKKIISTFMLAGLMIAPTASMQSNPAAYSLKAMQKALPWMFAGAATGSYIVGNIYARLMERAALYRFGNEIDQLQHTDGQKNLINTIRVNHYKRVNKKLRTQIHEFAQLLPWRKVAEHRKKLPLVAHQEDIDSYIDSLWWSRFWTLGQSKYSELVTLRILLEQVEEIVDADSQYTQELSKA